MSEVDPRAERVKGVKLPHDADKYFTLPNPFMPESLIVIFIHYKPRIAVAILDL